MRRALAFVLVSATTSAGPIKIETILLPAGREQPAYRLEVEGVERNDQFDENRRLAVIRDGRRTIVSVEGGLATTRRTGNRLHSKFVYAARPMPSNMVILFGHTFDTGPGAMRIIRLGVTPEQILSENEFDLTDLRKGADGRSLLVIGKHSFSQMSSMCVSSYDPYSVFKLSDGAKGRFQYSLALSKVYNLAHYAGWAGPDSREDIGVNICRKPARLVRP
jgi:hypothetical protein